MDYPLTKSSIHFESTTGPFHSEDDKIIPKWAPKNKNQKEEFIYNLKKFIES